MAGPPAKLARTDSLHRGIVFIVGKKRLAETRIPDRRHRLFMASADPERSTLISSQVFSDWG